MRLSPLSLALALGLVLLGTLSSGKPLEPCPSACRCFLSEGLKRADCKHVPEWADQQSDAQDVRILPPRPSNAGHPNALHLTHFEVFPKVLQLSVTNRSVIEIIPSGFHGLHSLQGLDLSHNLLSRFNFKVFLRMPALRRLVLQDNPIVLEPNTRLLSSRSLLSLDLSHCNIASIPPGSLNGMPKLTSLSLRGNPIQIRSGKPLLPLNTILELDLSACGLLSLPPKSLENLQNLRKLYLDGNKLLTIEKGVLPRGLHLLDMTSNQIRDVPTAVISSLANLTRLEMSENPIKCTCSLLGMQGWMSRQLVVIEKPVVCAEPPKFKGLPWHKVNELELCQDEESSSSSYSQSDSSDESSDSETQESEDSSQPLSIEIPPASYEVYTHENVIKHPQPALPLDHVLELKTLDFRSNNEINSIQGDQPYTHDVLGTEQDQSEEDPSSASHGSGEFMDDDQPPEKRSREQGHSSIDENSEKEIDHPFLPDDEDATEKDAEVFMINPDTIAMGKSMPGESPKSPEEQSKEKADETETATFESDTNISVTTQEPEENEASSEKTLGESEVAIEAAAPSQSGNEQTSKDVSSDSLEKSPVVNNPELTEAVVTTNIPTADIDIHSDQANTEHGTTAHPDDVIQTEAPENVHTGESDLAGNIDVSGSIINQEEETDFPHEVTTERVVIAATAVKEHDDVSLVDNKSEHNTVEKQENSNTKQPDLPVSSSNENIESGVTPATNEENIEHSSTENANIEHALIPNDPNHFDNIPSNEDSQSSTQKTSSIEETDPSVTTATTLEDAVSADVDTAKESDRSEHGRNFEDLGDPIGHIHVGGDLDSIDPTHADSSTPSTDVPVVEAEIHPNVVTHVLETINTKDTENSAVNAQSNNSEIEGTPTAAINPEHEDTTKSSESMPNEIVNKEVESVDASDKIEIDHGAQRTSLGGVKNSEDLAVDNAGSIPADAEEQKSTVTYVVLGVIVLAIVVLIVFALKRGKSEKKDGKVPVREDVGTEMKDMMNPLLEPNPDHPEPRRGLLGSLELIREVEEGKSTSGEVDAPEAASLLKPSRDDVEDAASDSPAKAPGVKGAAANGHIAEVVVEPPPVSAQKEVNGGPAVGNGQAAKHNGIPTVPSKVKVKAGVIHTPLPRTPVLVNRSGNGVANGTRGHL